MMAMALLVESAPPHRLAHLSAAVQVQDSQQLDRPFVDLLGFLLPQVTDLCFGLLRFETFFFFSFNIYLMKINL